MELITFCVNERKVSFNDFPENVACLLAILNNSRNIFGSWNEKINELRIN